MRKTLVLLPLMRSKFSHLAEDALVRLYACSPLIEDWERRFGVTLAQLEDRVLRQFSDVKEQALIRKSFRTLQPNVVDTFVLESVSSLPSRFSVRFA
jgi:hypothetical protein